MIGGRPAILVTLLLLASQRCAPGQEARAHPGTSAMPLRVRRTLGIPYAPSADGARADRLSMAHSVAPSSQTGLTWNIPVTWEQPVAPQRLPGVAPGHSFGQLPPPGQTAGAGIAESNAGVASAPVPGNWQVFKSRFDPGPAESPGSAVPFRQSPPLEDDWLAFTQELEPSHSVPWPTVVRFGWWHSTYNGSPTKVGEYQSLESSPFWDVDRIVSDGYRTFDFSLSGLDDEANQLRLRSIGPSLSADVEYDRYFRRLDRDPLDFFVPFDQQPPVPLPPPPANFRDMKRDTTVGQDFAIRVQELKTDFKGKLTKNIDWRVNIWAMRKKGQRQVMALGHCFTDPDATDTNGNPVTGVACHIVSQSQRIDWLTMELEPVLEGHYGPVTIEYSRTMRSLRTGDQLTVRPYDNFGFNGDFPYAVVPENLTQIDRLKMAVRFPGRRDVYTRFFIGTTENEYRDTVRRFRGYDVRLTDRAIAGLSLTVYSNGYVQKGTRPTALLPQETNASIRTPIGYDRVRLGFRGRWTPYRGEPSWRSRLTFSGGYEYGELRRSNATFIEQVLTADQSSTTTNIARLRASWRWSPQLDLYVGYRIGIINHPLYGVPTRNTTTNTSLPTDEHLVDLGATWMPSDVVLLSASLGIDNSGNTSDIASFQQDDYNISLTGWYAPTPRWTVSGGLAFLRSWIDQDITLGSKSNPFTAPWTFGGQSDVVNIGTTYAWTPTITLSGGYEFVRSANIATAPAPYGDIPPLSNVVVETSRFSTGIDYRWRPGFGCYFRYQFFDYEDRSQNYDSGTSDMLLFGADATY